MTIKELINALEEFDDNMIVNIIDDGWREDINNIEEHDGVVLLRNIGQEGRPNGRFFIKKLKKG